MVLDIEARIDIVIVNRGAMKPWYPMSSKVRGNLPTRTLTEYRALYLTHVDEPFEKGKHGMENGGYHQEDPR